VEADSVEADSVEADSVEADSAEVGSDEDDDERASSRRRRGRRGGRGRGSARAADDGDGDGDGEREPESDRDRDREREPESDRGRRRVREPVSDRGRDREREPVSDRARDREREPEPKDERDSEPEPKRDRVAAEEVIEGEVDLLPNGSAFVRINPPEPSDDDVYISAAQVKRCELVSGDRIAGPRRAPRRSERFASLVRIDTINGRPASEVAEGARFDDLPAAFPNDRFRLGSEDPTLKAIEWLTPFGKGSRVTITGAARAGKTEALRRLAAALAEHADLQLFVVAAGVRPEEISEWSATSTAPTASTSFGSSPDAQAHTIELVVDRARRAAARGGDAVVLIDTLDGLAPHAARKSIASARKIVDGGSVTVIATARDEIGGETTVIALDAKLAAAGRFPALDIVASGTIRPELLVGDAGAEAIARARAVAEDE
jgi:transcription termination factor Rho